MLTDLAAPTAVVTKLLELNFEGGAVWVTTAAQDITWSGMTFESIGGAISIEGFGESLDQGGTGNRLQFSGVSQEILALILGQNYRGRKARVWYAHLDLSSGIVIDGILMFHGYINEGFSISEERSREGGSVAISTKLVLPINDFIKIRGIRTNVQSHQTSGFANSATDTFFMNVPGLVSKRVRWGSKDPAPHKTFDDGHPYTPGTGVNTPNGPTGAKPNPPIAGPAGGGMINPGGMPWGSNPAGPGWGSTPTDSTHRGGGAPTMDPGRT